MTLPPELRTQVYSNVFDYKSINVRTVHGEKRFVWTSFPDLEHHFFHTSFPDLEHHFFHTSAPNKVLALLLVNHQISDEAAPYFYAKTKFSGLPGELIDFVNYIGSRRRSMIKKIKIVSDNCSRFSSRFSSRRKFEPEVLDLLSTLHNLSTVQLDFQPGTFAPELSLGYIKSWASRLKVNLVNPGEDVHDEKRQSLAKHVKLVISYRGITRTMGLGSPSETVRSWQYSDEAQCWTEINASQSSVPKSAEIVEIET